MNKGANLTSNCSHTPDHKKERIEYICIEPDCRSIRQLCNLCVIERHRKHNVFHIDRICFPMGLLNQNSYLPNSDRIYADLQNKASMVEVQCTRLLQTVERYVERIRNGLILQIRDIMKTFRNEEADRSYVLLTDNRTQPEEIEKIVKLMVYLEKYRQNGDEIHQGAVGLAANATRILKDNTVKIEGIMKRMTNKFQRMTIQSFFEQNAEMIKKEEEISEEIMMIQRPRARKPNKGKDDMESNNNVSFFKAAVSTRKKNGGQEEISQKKSADGGNKSKQKEGSIQI